MKILQLSLSYAPNWKDGGPPRIMYDYAVHLALLGHEITVLTPDANKAKSEQCWPGFPRGLNVNYFRKYNDWRRFFYFDFSYQELYGFFKKNQKNIDIIHLSQSRSLVNIVALKASKDFGIPIALSSFGSLPRRGGLLKLIYDKLFIYPLIRHSKLLLGQTENELSVYKKFGGLSSSLKLLPLAVDVNECPAPSPSEKGKFFPTYDIPEGNKLFLFLGRLHPSKGVPFLVKAFSKVYTENKKLTLAIVGNDEGVEGEVRSLSRELGVEAGIRFCGPLYGADRWHAYRAADVYIISPEIYEETALASIEALACGTPVITNTRADVPWLKEYEAGEVLKAGDISSLVNAMKAYANFSDSQMNEKKIKAELLFKEKFEIGNVCNRLDTYYKEVI